jgi:hypothetical protein
VSDLEHELRRLGRELTYPEGPSAATLARHAVAAGRGRRAPRRGVRIAVALALLVCALGVALAVPPVRSAILEWFGIRGVRVERVPQLPAATGVPPAAAQPAPEPGAEPGAPGARLGLGEPLALAEAERRAGFRVLVPGVLGPPDAVYVDQPAVGSRVTLVYEAGPELPEAEQTGVGLLLTQFRARSDEVLFKKVATDVRYLEVGGETGLWIEGAPHLVVLVDRPGGPVADEGRLAGNTLLWTVGEVTLRLEADVGFERALAIAESAR